jgi:hypothetical protein
MLDRFERAIKIACIGLGVLLGCRMIGAIFTMNSLSGLAIPALPTLAATTNEVPKVVIAEEAPSKEKPGKKEEKGTNSAKATNIVARTNLMVATNALAGTNGPSHGTNSAANETAKAAGPMPGRAGRGRRGGMFGGGPPSAPLPPETQARVDRIVDSEALGALMHTQLALLGIAGDQAFIRSTNGMSGPVAVDGEMGGVKLLRIGINRVLVDDGGEKKELTLFDGVGGESLMPKETNQPSTNAAASGDSLSTNTLLSSKK